MSKLSDKIIRILLNKKERKMKYPINYNKLGESLKHRIENASSLGRAFRILGGFYNMLEYEGGKENWLYETDCSGTVTGPLYALGYDIRCTADQLYKYIFTKVPRNASEWEDLDKILAVFYITQKPKEHFGRTVPTGTATHVTPVIGRYVVMNAFDPVQLSTAAYVRQWYEARDFSVEWREIDMDALQEHHEKKDLFFHIDPEMKELRA